MFAFLACIANCIVSTKDIKSQTDIIFGSSADRTKDRYAIILNSRDFELISSDKWIDCPVILKNWNKGTFKPSTNISNRTMLYTTVDLPKNEGADFVLNTITVPLILNPSKNSPKKTNVVFISAVGRTTIINTNAKGNEVTYTTESDTTQHPINSTTSFSYDEPKTFVVRIDMTHPNFVFQILDVKLSKKLNEDAQFNCGPFYYSNETTFFNSSLGFDNKKKDLVKTLKPPGQDVYIYQRQTISIKANTLVTLFLLQSSGSQVNFVAKQQNGDTIKPNDGISSLHFLADGTLEVWSDYVPYVRINLVRTHKWPAGANVYIKTGITPLEFTGDSASGKIISQTKPFVLVSINNYVSPQIAKKSEDGIDVTFYDYNSNDLTNMTLNYDPKAYPGSYVVSLKHNYTVKFMYLFNNKEYEEEQEVVSSAYDNRLLDVNKGEKKGLSGGLIAGIVIIVLIIIGASVGVAIFFMKKKNLFCFAQSTSA